MFSIYTEKEEEIPILTDLRLPVRRSEQHERSCKLKHIVILTHDAVRCVSNLLWSLVFLALFSIPVLVIFKVYRYVNNYASQEMQIYAAQPIIFSANETFNALASMRFLLIAFYCLHFCIRRMARKLYFNPLIFYTELNRYNVFHRNLSDVLCTVSTYVS